MRSILEEAEHGTPPLVSVVVITYCSADTLEETLNSILHQDYKRLELIITDDCSKDETYAIAEAWIRKTQETVCPSNGHPTRRATLERLQT